MDIKCELADEGLCMTEVSIKNGWWRDLQAISVCVDGLEEGLVWRRDFTRSFN